MYRHALRHGDMATWWRCHPQPAQPAFRMHSPHSSHLTTKLRPSGFTRTGLDRSLDVFGCLWVFALRHIVTYCDGTAVKFIQEIWTKSRYFMLFHLIFESAKWSKCWSILSSFVDVKKSCWRKKTGAAALEQQIFLPRDHGLRGHPIRCGRPKFPTAPTPHEFSTRFPKYVSSSPFFFHVIPFFLCLSINKTVRKPRKPMIHKSSLEGTCVQIENKEIFTKRWFSCIFPIFATLFLTFAKCRQGWRSGTRHSWSASPRCRKPCPGPTLKDGVLKVLKVLESCFQNTKQFFLRNEIDGMCQNGYVVNWYELICDLCLYPGDRVVLYFGLHGLHGLAENGKTHGFCDKVCAAMPGSSMGRVFCEVCFLFVPKMCSVVLKWSEDRKVKWLLKWPGKEKFRNQYSVSENES